MKNQAVKIDGKNVIYQESQIISVIKNFTLWERIKILFGCTVVTSITIFTKTPARIAGRIAYTALTFKKIPNDTQKNDHPDTVS